MGFVDGRISVCGSCGVGICDRDAAKRFACDFAWALSRKPLRVKKIVVFVSVAMRPTIDSDGVNVARGIEATHAKNSAELIANVALECFERSGKQVAAANFMLVTFGKAGVARSPFHADEDRFIGIPWCFVLADVHRHIQIHLIVIHARRGYTSYSEV